MKRIATAVAGAALVLVSAASAGAQAKTSFLVLTGGASLPMGDYKEYAKTGWMAAAGIGYNVTNKVFVAALGNYGSNSHETEGDKTNLIGVGGTAGMSFGSETAKMLPYVRGIVGYLNHQYKSDNAESESEWKPMFGAGAGLIWPKGKKAYFIDAAYMTRDGTDFVVLGVGLTWSLSGGQ